MLQDASKVLFEGPEARYFRNAVIPGENVQPFRHCNNLKEFLQKVYEIKSMRTMGFGLPKNKVDWYLYGTSEEKYPHSEYVPWRLSEEENMSLSCLGQAEVRERITNRGQPITKYVSKRQHFGLFASDTTLGLLLGSKWKRKVQNRGLTTSAELFSDIISIRSSVKYSIFLYFSGQLPLLYTQRKIAALLLCGSGNNLKKTERICLEKIAWLLDEKRFKTQETFLDKKLNIKKGSKLIVNITDHGGLSAEIISPGAWARSECNIIGHIIDTFGSKAILNLCLGDIPLNNNCKQNFGIHALYLSNGGKLPRSRLESSITFRDMNDWSSPQAPEYPFPRNLTMNLCSKTFYLQSKSTREKYSNVSLKYLDNVRRENRNRVLKISNEDFLNDSKSAIKLALKLKNSRALKTPESIKKYPVEFARLQSPFAYSFGYNPSSSNEDTEEYNLRVNPSDSPKLYCPVKVPKLSAIENELTCLDVRTHVITENNDNVALTQPNIIGKYVTERGKRDPYYIGFNVGQDLKEKISHGESVGSWRTVYQQWQQR